jgi:hypothetical protein
MTDEYLEDLRAIKKEKGNLLKDGVTLLKIERFI